MASVKWRMKGNWIKNCNCAYGCPCDFNALPTHGKCQGMVAMKITAGHFGKTDLSGLSWAAVVDFPGALHEGNGTMQAIIDDKATPEQKEALLTILSGKEQDEGTMFHIFSLITSKMLEPLFKPIEFSFDLAKRQAHLRIPGVLETQSEPIKNPVTGAPHRIRVVMPDGFEHDEGEIASARILKSTGGIKYSYKDTHSTLATVDHGPKGVVHPAR